MQPSQAQLADLLETLQAAADRKRYRAIDFFRPRPKQLEFIAATRDHSEVMFRAANQIIGKSEVGAHIVARHLTGDYQPGWQGKVFTKPITCWAAGVKGTDVRDVSQAKLCGDPPGIEDAYGTAHIPRAAFEGTPSMARGVTDLYDTVHVKHLAPGGGGTIDGISTLRFKTYPEERRGFQGKPVDLVWLDEEPQWEVYAECKARTLATNGQILVTLTPLEGRTALVDYYEKADAPHIAMVKAGLNDADHLSDEKKAEILSKYATAHDRDARLYGAPLMGSGRVFTTEEASLRWTGEERAEWAYIWGLDFGVTHPFAAVLLGWDRDADVVYVLHTIRMSGATKAQHIPLIRARAANVPVAWPHDMAQRREAGDGNLAQLAAQYRNPGPGIPGLNMLSQHATFPDGSNSTWAGVNEMIDRMETARFRVRASLDDFWEEYREYHTKDGMLVKQRDDILSACRTGLMMKRYARSVPLGHKAAPPRRGNGVARDVDYDLNDPGAPDDRHPSYPAFYPRP